MFVCNQLCQQSYGKTLKLSSRNFQDRSTAVSCRILLAKLDKNPHACNKKLNCRREVARCFVSLNILLSHSRSLKDVECSTIRKPGYGFLLSFHSNYGHICSRFATMHDCTNVTDIHPARQTPCDGIGRVYAQHRCDLDECIRASSRSVLKFYYYRSVGDEQFCHSVMSTLMLREAGQLQQDERQMQRCEQRLWMLRMASKGRHSCVIIHCINIAYVQSLLK